MEWNIDMEVNLFHAMRGHKPAGVNKHFQMIAIHEKLSSSAKKITSEDIWKHLATLYDLHALNESEIVPFPNKNGDFNLTDKEILDLCPKTTFPRSSFISSAPSEASKPEVSANSKISVKSVKSESKSPFQTPKSEAKSESKAPSSSKSESGRSSSTPGTTKSDVSRSSTPSSRSEHKSSGGSSSAKTPQLANSAHTPLPSPNRRQRKRNANSSSASPATPSTESHGKRRR